MLLLLLALAELERRALPHVLAPLPPGLLLPSVPTVLVLAVGHVVLQELEGQSGQRVNS